MGDDGSPESVCDDAEEVVDNYDRADILRLPERNEENTVSTRLEDTEGVRGTETVVV